MSSRSQPESIERTAERQRVLYHFTKAVHLAAIQREGLLPTYVPKIGERGGVWLTDDGRWYKQRWGMTRGNVSGIPLAYRLAVAPGAEGPNLVHWPELAKRLHVPDLEYQALHKTGGRASDRWWVYLGVIPPEGIVRVKARPGGVPAAEHTLHGTTKFACPQCVYASTGTTVDTVFDTVEDYDRHRSGAHARSAEPPLLVVRRGDVSTK